MIRLCAGVLLLAASFKPACSASQASDHSPPRRIVILKIDGLNADLLYRSMREINPETGKSRLPWFSHIFAENGTIFENFYTRGISLSAPSWSMLDTGHHTVIRGNVEYDRYTGHVYDYLNFFPFYIGYARNRHVDMPGVEVLDRAGIPLLIDALPYQQTFQSFQLFQRGVRWKILAHALQRRFSSRVLLSTIENAEAPSLDEMLGQQTEAELTSRLTEPEIFYLDLYTGEVDHEGHATNQPAALQSSLHALDGLAGRLWTAIQASPLATQTIFVAVSDHGMNNVPGVFSQGFSLPDFFNSPAGGAHHVITNRHQLSDYKLLGLNPLVQRVITPSTASFYLAGQSDHYPTAWLDLDGNERASIHLRSSDLNRIHILLLQLGRGDLAPAVRSAAAGALQEIIDRHRSDWTRTADDLQMELNALQHSISEREALAKGKHPKWTRKQETDGDDKQAHRFTEQLLSSEREHGEYTTYLAHLRALLKFKPDEVTPFREKISALVPAFALGDNNGVGDLQRYVVGPAEGGLVVGRDGKLDEAHSFRCLDYFALLTSQRVRNNPQSALSSRPVDFTAMRLPDGEYVRGSGVTQHAYWLYVDELSQLLILDDGNGRLALLPVDHLTADDAGRIHYSAQSWRSGLPLALFEEPELHLPSGAERSAWLSEWHKEREWLLATHMGRYSNAVVGIMEELSPVGDNVPGPAGVRPLLSRYERRRRELVQPDFDVFAADHWNFNVRNFNPGGNHGSFFRISTHSVWMMAGAGVPARVIADPYDSLNFASTILSLSGRTPAMSDRVVVLP